MKYSLYSTYCIRQIYIVKFISCSTSKIQRSLWDMTSCSLTPTQSKTTLEFCQAAETGNHPSYNKMYCDSYFTPATTISQISIKIKLIYVRYVHIIYIESMRNIFNSVWNILTNVELAHIEQYWRYCDEMLIGSYYELINIGYALCRFIISECNG